MIKLNTQSIDNAYKDISNNEQAALNQNMTDTSNALLNNQQNGVNAYSGMQNDINSLNNQQTGSLRSMLSTVGQTPDQSTTIQNNADMGLKNALGTLTTAQQKLISDTQYNIQQLRNAGQGQLAVALANVSANKLQAMADEQEKENEFTAQENAKKVDYLMKLFEANKMTASQFENQYKAITGQPINVKAYVAGRRHARSSPGTDANDYARGVDTGLTAGESIYGVQIPAKKQNYTAGQSVYGR